MYKPALLVLSRAPCLSFPPNRVNDGDPPSSLAVSVWPVLSVLPRQLSRCAGQASGNDCGPMSDKRQVLLQARQCQLLHRHGLPDQRASAPRPRLRTDGPRQIPGCFWDEIASDAHGIDRVLRENNITIPSGGSWVDAVWHASSLSTAPCTISTSCTELPCVPSNSSTPAEVRLYLAAMAGSVRARSDAAADGADPGAALHGVPALARRPDAQHLHRGLGHNVRRGRSRRASADGAAFLPCSTRYTS